MKLDSKLNLVVPVGNEGEEVNFHSMLITNDTFRRYHFAIAKAFNKIFMNDMQITGPQIAAMTVEEVSVELGVWEDRQDERGRVTRIGVKNGLIEEIKRLTNVIVLLETGWGPIPVSDAIERNLIEEDQWETALQRIVFFTLTSVMLPKGAADDVNRAMGEIWRTQLTSLSCSDFAVSLRQSMRDKSSAETPLPAIS